MSQASALHLSATLAKQVSALRSEAAQMSYRHSRNDIYDEPHVLEDLVESLDSLNEHKFPQLTQEIESSLPDDLDELATSICASLSAARHNFHAAHANLRRPFRSTFSDKLLGLSESAYTLQKACKGLDDELCPSAPAHALNEEAWVREADEDTSSDTTSANTTNPRNPPSDPAAYREHQHYPFERIAYIHHMTLSPESEASTSADCFKAYMEYTSDPDNTDCAICYSALSEVSSVAITDCKHVFCLLCIDRAIRSQAKCPMCRAECVRCRIFEERCW